MTLGEYRVSSGAADELLDLLQQMAPGRDVPYAHGLPAVARVLRSDAVGWHVLGAGGSVCTHLWPMSTLNGRAEDLMREYGDTHPLANHYAKTASMDILTPADVCSGTEWRSSMAYSLLRAEFGISEQLVIPTCGEGADFRCFVLGRAGGRYSDEDRTNAFWVQRMFLAAERRCLGVRPHNGHPLTECESRVIAMLGKGRTRYSTARALGCSPRTVDKHVENVFRKLEVNNLVAALLVLGTNR
ncbi:LuxR C-terminal-related transcriptional regulator [Nocardioides sp. S-58]|uniref:LuxR C-terminal-related transcriptional regulator n=1 Tax=Nocardioides renjunii TaxID=3095075 RepID=A0ABU5KEI1_9ACTN|nr:MULTISPECIES: LuxR C-terminal-related transcriptional regulator [unclassified Nocardioides]MDZ5663377.1 LuxR C-terminal-related transcriptional regulator [Nocardioides sp. S-58]WQQ22752.1 LuxR C-terminal-related transcriptional regulator [Nocardioides sp. S-34]